MLAQVHNQTSHADERVIIWPAQAGKVQGHAFQSPIVRITSKENLGLSNVSITAKRVSITATDTLRIGVEHRVDVHAGQVVLIARKIVIGPGLQLQTYSFKSGDHFDELPDTDTEDAEGPRPFVAVGRAYCESIEFLPGVNPGLQRQIQNIWVAKAGAGQ
ncbi:MAG: hypothetical protein RL235_529 [Chlamydiota bacterium]|jgi:hypothetical protein